MPADLKEEFPGHVTLYLCPHRFYGVQPRMIGRESLTVMPMFPQDIVKDILWLGFLSFTDLKKLKNMKKNTSKYVRFWYACGQRHRHNHYTTVSSNVKYTG